MNSQTRPALKIVVLIFTKIVFSVLIFSIVMASMWFVYKSGYFKGFYEGQIDTEQYYFSLMEEAGLQLTQEPVINESVDGNSTSPAPMEKTTIGYKTQWNGPDLWEAVNARRVEFGVNPLSSRDELCTIASIRLNELLALGTLDNHEGFGNLQENRSDLEWIFEKYSTVAEFLAFGGQSAQETVSMWEDTLGHKKLLTGGEYVWGCIYAQNSFAVAITAF